MLLAASSSLAKLCTFIAHPKVYHCFPCFACLNHMLQNTRYWLSLCLISTKLLALLTLSYEGSTRIKIKAHFFLQLADISLGGLSLRKSDYNFAMGQEEELLLL